MLVENAFGHGKSMPFGDFLVRQVHVSFEELDFKLPFPGEHFGLAGRGRGHEELCLGVEVERSDHLFEGLDGERRLERGRERVEIPKEDASIKVSG